MNKSRHGRYGGGGRSRSTLALRRAKGGAGYASRSQEQGSKRRQAKNRQTTSRQTSNRQGQNQQNLETLQPQFPFWNPWDHPPHEAIGAPVPEFAAGEPDQQADGPSSGREPFFDDW